MVIDRHAIANWPLGIVAPNFGIRGNPAFRDDSAAELRCPTCLFEHLLRQTHHSNPKQLHQTGRKELPFEVASNIKQIQQKSVKKFQASRNAAQKCASCG
jgi:hypothetical protein